MLYCITNLPMYSVEVGLAYLGMIPQFLLRPWPGSHLSCQAFAMFRYFNAFASWMSVAMVAFSRYFYMYVHCVSWRCLSITHKGRRLGLHGNRLMVAVVWAFAGAIVLAFHFGGFGNRACVLQKLMKLYPKVVLDLTWTWESVTWFRYKKTLRMKYFPGEWKWKESLLDFGVLHSSTNYCFQVKK